MDTLLVNDRKISELTAQRVVEARSALAEAREAVEEAELAFRALEVESVTLADGTKVAIVNQNRRSIDNDVLKAILPQGQHQRVTKRVGEMKLIDGAVEAGWLDSDLVGKAINIKEVSSVKVTQPRR
tara:strand:+ start:6887 stop:7267 length:381 start_codon:yes stop_codon:yes gene_type:complete